MHPALRTLIKLRVRGGLRRLARGLKTPRGILFTLLVVVGLATWLWPAVMAIFVENDALRQGLLAANAETILPLILLLISAMTILTSAGERAIYFSPAEVNLLFASPFRRRELLTYKLSMSLLAHATISLIFATGFLIYFNWWLATYLGMVLTLVFLQLLGMTVALIGQTISRKLFTRTRQAIGIAVVAAAAVGIMQTFSGGDTENLLERLHAFKNSWAMTCLLAPFEVFARTISAGRLWPELLGWGSLALSINLALLMLVIRLDANYLEVAALASDRVYARLQQVRSGGMAMRLSRSSRWSLPPFGWLGGIGPVAWRQLTRALRTSRSLVTITLVFGVIGGGVAFTIQTSEPGTIGSPLAALGALIYANFLISLQVPLAFRGDLDRMESLKTLPVQPDALVWGQLIGPALLLTAPHLLLLVGFGVVLRAWYQLLIVAAGFVLPVNLLMLAVSNLVFLVFPTRIIPKSAGDLQHLGRNMLFSIIMMLSLLACFGAATGAGALAFFLGGKSWAFAVTAGWGSVIVELVLVVRVVGWAFQRFDVSRHTPA